MKMKLDPDNQDNIIAELDLYKNAVGEFGHSLAIHQREKINPGIIIYQYYLLNSVTLYFKFYFIFTCI